LETILDLCGGTGAWSKPYADEGYNVLNVDIATGSDVRLFKKIDEPVHGILAAPPCTHLAGSGARWWAEKGESALLESLSIVDACMRIILVHKPKWWCLENPVGRLVHYLGKPKVYFHPNDYAGYSRDPMSNEYSKKTCLWGNFKIPPKRAGLMRNKDFIWKMPPSEERTMLRSMTPDGFARAHFDSNRYTWKNGRAWDILPDGFIRAFFDMNR